MYIFFIFFVFFYIFLNIVHAYVPYTYLLLTLACDPYLHGECAVKFRLDI